MGFVEALSSLNPNNKIVENLYPIRYLIMLEVFDSIYIDYSCVLGFGGLICPARGAHSLS